LTRLFKKEELLAEEKEAHEVSEYV